MHKEELKEMIPHREPMLLIDEAELDETGKIAYSKTTIRGDEYFLQGHFPGNPIVPGVIQCEIMGQTCCVLLEKELKNRVPMFTGMDKVKFKRMVVPGDVIEVKAYITRQKHPFYFTHCEAYVAGELAAQGELSFVLQERKA